MNPSAKKALIFSPSDLVTFSESRFSAWANRCFIERPDLLTPDPEDESAKMLIKRGLRHEAEVLRLLETKYGAALQIPSLGDQSVTNDDRLKLTLNAMKNGAPLIYQAYLKGPLFEGYADFLIRAGQSPSGTWIYEPYDSKLSLEIKSTHIIQLCCYAELLEHIQGHRPKQAAVILGNQEIAPFPIDSYFYYYLRLKEEFIEFQKCFDFQQAPFPKKGEKVWQWNQEVEKRLLGSDHLLQIANIRNAQAIKIMNAGIPTLEALANSDQKNILGMGKATFERLKKQAKLQSVSRQQGKIIYELIDPPVKSEDEKSTRWGLELLPPKSDSDVYFDMEGFPLHKQSQGLEYLFGITHLVDGAPAFQDWWAHNWDQEKVAFSECLGFIYRRWKSSIEKGQSMHIYHYGHYEVSAFRRLAQRHDIMNEQLTELIINHIFVNLQTVMTQTLMAGTTGYSLKDLEKLYGFKRTADVGLAADSLVEYDRWCELQDGDSWKTSKILSAIRDYNEEDCHSTLKMTDFLRELQSEAGMSYVPPDVIKDEQDEKKESDPGTQLANHIREKVTADADLSRPKNRIQMLLANLVNYHRREQAPKSVAYYTQLGSSHEDLKNDTHCLGDLRRSKNRPQSEKSSLIYHYSFDSDQPTRVVEDERYLAVPERSKPSVYKISMATGEIWLKIEKSSDLGRRVSLIPNDFVSPEPIKSSIFDTILEWHEKGESNGLTPALKEFLHRASPTFKTHPKGQNLADPSQDLVRESCRLTLDLKHSFLVIQGPPGTGKTYTGARIAAELIKKGKVIGITGPSHHAIKNLLTEVISVCREKKIKFNGAKIGGGDKKFCEEQGIVFYPSGSKTRWRGDHNCIAGTAWAFSHPAAISSVDYLIVDEAGQVALANFFGMARSADNLIFLGDPMQLEMPTQAIHEHDSGKACLSYFVDDQATISPDKGVFLETTRRMHPKICQFISEHFYDGRLIAHADTAFRELVGIQKTELIKMSAGIQFMPIAHEDRCQSSPEEVEMVERLISEVMKLEWQETRDHARPIVANDIMVLAPYNQQVNLLRSKLRSGVRIGTVDMFQGQEAPIVIVSITASSLQDAPRGADFLFSKHRLNVSLSRAKTLAIVVGNPSLAAANCKDPEDMALVNLFCQIIATSSL